MFFHGWLIFGFCMQEGITVLGMRKTFLTLIFKWRIINAADCVYQQCSVVDQK